MERFFPLNHLTVEQLRDLYRDACQVGKLLVEYDQPGIEGHYEVNLPEDEILKNISGESQNYLVFHEDFEEEPDATTVAFPLSEHPLQRLTLVWTITGWIGLSKNTAFRNGGKWKEASESNIRSQSFIRWSQ